MALALLAAGALALSACGGDGGGQPAAMTGSMVLETSWGQVDGEPEGVFPSREGLAASGVCSSPHAFDNRRADGLPDELDCYDEAFFSERDLAVVAFSNAGGPGTARVTGVDVVDGEAVVEVCYEASPPGAARAAVQRDCQAFAPVPKGECASARAELRADGEDVSDNRNGG